MLQSSEVALKRVFSVMMEMIENVAKYSPGKDMEEQFGMPLAIIRFRNKTYTLTTGNLIQNEKLQALREKLDKINKCDRDGLLNLFRSSLMEQTASSDSTGMLGLIDMARKSGSKLIYQFDRVNETYSYFIMTVKIEDQPNHD